MTSRIILFGIVAGLIPLIGFFVMPHDGSVDIMVNMLVGYSLMILGSLFIYFTVKRYRDVEKAGIISFGKAFLIGLYMSLIASVVYASGWEMYIHNNVDGFIESYSNMAVNQMQRKGATEAQIAAKRIELNSQFEGYRNSAAVRFGFTLMEILPVTILASLISAATLRRKQRMVL